MGRKAFYSGLMIPDREMEHTSDFFALPEKHND
jgi:hypothetical protein